MSAKSQVSNLHQHTAQFREQANTLGKDVQELGRITRNIAQDTMDMVRDNAGEYYNQGMDKAKSMEQNLEGRIRENPLQSLLIAAGVGVVLGWLFRRR